MSTIQTDVIGDFPIVDPNCLGCGKPLLLENAWMTDGCPCNTPLGVNNQNETRWRLLMRLQQDQSCELAALKKPVEEREIEQVTDACESFAKGASNSLDASMFRHVAIVIRRLSADKARMEEALTIATDALDFVARAAWAKRPVLEAAASKALDKIGDSRAALPKQKATS